MKMSRHMARLGDSPRSKGTVPGAKEHSSKFGPPDVFVQFLKWSQGSFAGVIFNPYNHRKVMHWYPHEAMGQCCLAFQKASYRSMGHIRPSLFQ